MSNAVQRVAELCSPAPPLLLLLLCSIRPSHSWLCPSLVLLPVALSFFECSLFREGIRIRSDVLRPMSHPSEPNTRSGEREGKSPHFLACARVRRFLLFSLHLFTFWGQSAVNQMHVCEGFTPFSFTGEVLKRPSPSPATYLLSVG